MVEGLKREGNMAARSGAVRDDYLTLILRRKTNRRTVFEGFLKLQRSLVYFMIY